MPNSRIIIFYFILLAIILFFSFFFVHNTFIYNYYQYYSFVEQKLFTRKNVCYQFANYFSAANGITRTETGQRERVDCMNQKTGN